MLYFTGSAVPASEGRSVCGGSAWYSRQALGVKMRLRLGPEVSKWSQCVYAPSYAFTRYHLRRALSYFACAVCTVLLCNTRVRVGTSLAIDRLLANMSLA